MIARQQASRPSRGEGVGEKTLVVLNCLVEAGPEATLAELAELSGLPKPTAHRVLKMLAELGYATANGQGRYSVGPALLGLAGRALSQRQIPRHARKALESLRDEVGRTVHLAVRSGRQAIYVDKIESRQPYHLVSHVGMSIPLHCTSIGKAILAAMPRDEADALLQSGPIEARTEKTITSYEAMMDELDRTRALGYAIDNEENENGVTCVGAAVYDSLGDVLGAVSVSALTLSLHDGELGRAAGAVRTAADEVSAALGSPREVRKEGPIGETASGSALRSREIVETREP
jgi:DNA-binding IclR family transcriptional regulator